MSFQSRAHSLTFPFPRRLLKLCVKGIKKNGLKRNDTKQDSLLEDCLLDVLKVMLNITHDYGKCPATCVCRLEKIVEILNRECMSYLKYRNSNITISIYVLRTCLCVWGEMNVR